jgi:hypothetical protein
MRGFKMDDLDKRLAEAEKAASEAAMNNSPEKIYEAMRGRLKMGSVEVSMGSLPKEHPP